MGAHIGSGVVFAGSSSAPLRISATVARSCRFSTMSSSAASVSGTNTILDINCLHQSSANSTPISDGSSPIKNNGQLQQVPVTRTGQGDSTGGYVDYLVVHVNF